MNKEENTPIWLLLICVIIFFGVIGLFAFWTITDLDGNLLAHKYTNIPCNSFYNEKYNGWDFEINSSSINQFIEECKSRGIGN